MHPTTNRVLMTIDLEYKNKVTLQGTGIELYHGRDFNNLDKRHTMPIQGIVVSSDKIPTGAMVLVHHNSAHDVNRVFNHTSISGIDIASDVKLYSIPEAECYVWKMPEDKEWTPCFGFMIGLRIFKPYNGILAGIKPQKIKNKLYITKGSLAGNVVITLIASDYKMTYRNDDGVEDYIITCRHFEGEELNEYEEVICVDGHSTELVKKGELYVGYGIEDCKPLTEKKA